jgi:hypothetical protein
MSAGPERGGRMWGLVEPPSGRGAAVEGRRMV